MGKIKRERQKFHISPEENKTNLLTKSSDVPKYKPLPLDLNSSSNIFAGINIQLDHINKLEVDDQSSSAPKLSTQSINPIKSSAFDKKLQVASDKSIKIASNAEEPQKHLTKKEKMRLKHDKFMKKLDVVQQARKESQEKQKKKKLKPAKESLLPTPIDFSSISLNLEPSPVAVKPKVVQKPIEAPKNIFSVPSFKDDLPALNSIFKIKPKDAVNAFGGGKSASKRNQKSAKGIQKHEAQKKFVNNLNTLKKLMAQKKK